MCLIALALDQHRRFPLVIAANRDEFFARPSARMCWWTPPEGGPQVLSGRDLTGGGTWMGLTAEGRLAMVTNIRKPVMSPDPDAPSRGRIVTRWLRGDQPAHRFWPEVALTGHAPFNLIALDFREGEAFWASSEQASPRRLERGLYGLSNAQLDTPWPKVQRLKERTGQALRTSSTVEDLATRLFEALADREPASDASLPHTGVGIDRERMLSPLFIRSPDGRYGTRASTLVIAERVNKRLVTHVLERSFGQGPGVALLRRTLLRHWPPRYLLEPGQEPQDAAPSPVQDVDWPAAGAGSDGTLPAQPRQRRVRSLIRPARHA